MKKQKIISLSLDILIFSLYALILFYILSNNVIFDLDDIRSTIKSYPFWREENGRYICNFISRVIGVYIPALFKVNLQDNINSFGALIFTLIIISLIKLTASFSFLNGRNKIISSLLMLLVFTIFLNYFLISHPNYVFIYSFQYGYVLASIFGFGFLYYLFNFLINNKLPPHTTKHIILYTILGFCAGNSCQIVTASCAVVVLLSFILFNNKFKENFSDKILKYPIISYFCGFLLMVFSPGFWIEVSWRHSNSLNCIINDFIPFIKKFYQILYLEQIYNLKIVLGLVLTIIILGFLNKNLKNTVKSVIIAILPITGTLCYFFALILGGRTFPSEPPDFWIQEPYYFYYYLMVIALLICFLTGILISQIKNIYCKYIILIIITGFIINGYKGIFIFFPSNVINRAQELNQIRTIIYKCNKTVLNQYYHGNQNIYVPEICNLTTHLWDDTNYYKKVYKLNLKDFNFVISDNIETKYTEKELKELKFKNINKKINEFDNDKNNF